MKDYPSLRFIDIFKTIFEKLGIDYPVMRRILQIKLTLDRRRVPTIFNQQNSQNKDKDDNKFLKSLWIYAILGLFIIPFLFIGNNYAFQMSIAFGVIMFVVMTSMISDFSSVLLDIRDQNILGTKPVSSNTIAAAKVIHICIYLFFLTAAVVTIPLVVSLFTHGPLFFLLFILNVIFMDVFVIVLTAMIYFAILKFFDGEKLKDIINYVQIGLSIGVIVGYQLVARSFEFIDLNIVFNPSWWQFFIPPIWNGATFEYLLSGNRETIFAVFSALAVVVPIISLIIYIKLMPAFERHLQKLSNPVMNNKKGKVDKRGKLGGILFKNKEERAFFHFASLMMKNEREFRLKVYPSIGFALIFPFLLIFTEWQNTSFEELSKGNMYLSIYLATFMIPTAIIMLKYSGKYKGAWLFQTTPLKDTKNLLSGTMKAFFIKLFVPVFLLLVLIFVGMFGIRIIPDLIAVFLCSSIYVVISSKMLQGTLPFSESFSAIQQSDGWKTIPFMFISGAFWFVHYFVGNLFDYSIYIYIVILLIVNKILWQKAI